MNTAEKPSDTLYVHLYQGAKGSTFQYYEDDGSSFDNERGVYYLRNIAFNPQTRTVSFGNVEGSATSKFTQVKLLFHGNIPNHKGKSESYAFIDPMPFFDPIGTGAQGPTCAVKTMTMPLPGNGKLEVKY